MKKEIKNAFYIETELKLHTMTLEFYENMIEIVANLGQIQGTLINLFEIFKETDNLVLTRANIVEFYDSLESRAKLIKQMIICFDSKKHILNKDERERYSEEINILITEIKRSDQVFVAIKESLYNTIYDKIPNNGVSIYETPGAMIRIAEKAIRQEGIIKIHLDKLMKMMQEHSIEIVNDLRKK